MTDLGTFTVSGEWMQACGYGNEPRTYPVLRVMEFPGRGEGFERMFKLDKGDGDVWIVAELRGTYLPAVNDLTVYPDDYDHARGGFYGDLDRAIDDLEEPGGCGAMRFKRFFSIDDAKAVKAQKVTKGWLNAINYMAPASSAGVGNLCPHATAGCIALCLGEWSGQAGMRLEGKDNSVTRSRKAKAVYYMRERVAFMRECAWHIGKALVRARADGRRLCVRLNGSTDIAWESARVFLDHADAAALSKLLGERIVSGTYLLMGLFPDVQFIDYTKSVKRALRALTDPTWPANYRLTFSRSEDNESDCAAVLRAGGNVAVVSSLPRPRTWMGVRTVDGDKHDLRHLDPLGSVVWLSPKGNKAKRDASGFVLREAR